VAEHLPSMHKSLGLILSTARKQDGKGITFVDGRHEKETCSGNWLAVWVKL
jgi:hypothetical protein